MSGEQNQDEEREQQLRESIGNERYGYDGVKRFRPQEPGKTAGGDTGKEGGGDSRQSGGSSEGENGGGGGAEGDK